MVGSGSGAQPGTPTEPMSLREQWELARVTHSPRHAPALIGKKSGLLDDQCPFDDLFSNDNDEPTSPGSLVRRHSARSLHERKNSQLALVSHAPTQHVMQHFMLPRSSSGVSGVSSSYTTTASNSSAGRRARASIQSMSLTEIQEAYVFEEQGLRKGCGGTVLRFATRAYDSMPVAIKVRHKAGAFEGDVRKELRWLKTMKAQLDVPKSDAVCELIEVIQTDSHYYTVMEKVEGRDLRSWWTRSRVQFRHDIVQEIVRQILQGVQSLHSARRLHRDLKFEHVMVNMSQSSQAARSCEGRRSQLTATLINFDSAATWRETVKETRLIGSGCYSAPETFQGQFSPASDVYSVGVMMYKLLTREFPVEPELFELKLGEEYVGSPSAQRIFKLLRNHKIDFDFWRSTLEACPEASELCKSLLAFRPEQRPSAEEALKHPWFFLDALPEWRT